MQKETSIQTVWIIQKFCTDGIQMNKILQNCTWRVDWICQFSCGYEVLGALTESMLEHK